jgi:hypothetical protein
MGNRRGNYGVHEMSEWIKCSEMLPAIGDYSVVACFDNGNPKGIDLVHVQDYFEPITSGIDKDGNQLYTKWYLTQKVTHWMPLPEEPKD